MKKNNLLYALLIVLIAFAAYYFFTQEKGTLSDGEGALSDFSIEDTASVSKIFIADAQGGKVALVREGDKWMVDGKYLARPDNIKLLLKTFYRVEVKMPVPNSAFDNVVRNIATNPIKVEIYQGKEEPSKVYYLGGPTANHQGTYMLLEKDGVKSSAPYIMHIPGFYGYLTTRFFTNPQQWRDAVVFKYRSQDIKRISVKYYETPEESFVINQKDKELELVSSDGQVVGNIDAERLKDYVGRYQKIYYEMIDEDSAPEKIDSVKTSQPYFSITVNSVDGDSNQIVVYHMPNFRTLIAPDGDVHEFDVDRMYGYLNNELFLYVQFATFDQLRLPKTYFLKKH